MSSDGHSAHRSLRFERRSYAAWRAAVLAGMAMLLLAPSASSAAGPWGVPVTLSGYGEGVAFPLIAMNDAGSAVVVWTSRRGSHSQVRVATRPAGGVLGPPRTLTGGDDLAYRPDVAIDGLGGTIVVWPSERGSRSRVMAASRPPGATRFGAPVALSAPTAKDVIPYVAMNAAGDAIVTWAQFNGRKFIVQVTSRPAGGSFGAPVGVSGPLEQLAAAVKYVESKPSIDAAGNATVVWESRTGNGGVIQGALRPAAGRFGAPIALSAGTESFEPDLATNARGETVLAWYARAADGESLVVRASIRLPGGAFAPAVDVSAPEEDIYGPSVAIGDAGDAIVAWTPEDYDGVPELVDTAVRAPGGGFVALPDISRSRQNAFYPSVAVGAGGAMAAVWTTGGDLDGVGGGIRPSGGAFALGDVAAHAPFASPEVDIDASGHAIAVWTQTADSTRSIVASGSGDVGALLQAGLPSVRRLQLAPSRLRAARSGPAFGRGAAPRSVARLTLDVPASVLFSVERARSGRRSSIDMCDVPTRRNRRDRPCTRFVPVGRQTVVLPAGPVRVRFSGRVGGRPLRPGRYRLMAVPTVSGRRGSASRTPFTVVR